ncbi:protein turtle-like [Varroa jacobsoni]|uniref:Protein turtle n=1 Tax=Varroa destructor TaxID=109461 RepID=A0A7M7M8X7_VARDE|nr:protein turtle-like isoform X2 [Varroa destructor]XP_022701501.1 protein turtle-like [Varroa jacobsoni]
MLYMVILSYVAFTYHTVKGNGEELPQKSATQGDNVILDCPFEYPDGTPVPYLVQWHKKDHKIPIYIWYDGYPPHASDDYKDRVSLSGKSSLNLTNVREADKGWYECKVFFLSRETMKNGTWIYLDVLAPPHFRSKPPEILYVKVGESLVLPCKADGTPAPQLTWEKEGQLVEVGADKHVSISDTELKIGSLRQTDVGEYVCVAKNSQGSVSASSKVIIAGPAVITSPPTNLTKIEGNHAEFICEAKALPANITHRWLYNGIDIAKVSWLYTRTLLRQDGTLFIYPTSAEDSGWYTCEISNGIGQPDSATAYLNIEYPARVNFTPNFQYMPLHLPGMIRCFIQSNPNIQFVTWYKDRRPFDANAMNDIVMLNNGSLYFQNVTHEHQGRYLCSPFNIHGNGGASKIMEVLVREPPVFRIKPKEIYQQPRNTEISMSCEGKGHPAPTVTWRRADGKPLPKQRHLLYKGNLTLRSIQKEDHGRYECIIQNEVATLVTSSLLLVESTTPHAPTNVSVNTSAFAATVSWLPGYDGGHKQEYIIWYRLAHQEDVDWRTIRVVPENAVALTIHNLQPESVYEFQVLSRNAFGDGYFSEKILTNTSKWNYIEGAYPTDAYGATYIPTVNRTPTGPKPPPPQAVVVKEPLPGQTGIHVSWSPPPPPLVSGGSQGGNHSLPGVSYYTVEYKLETSNAWVRSKSNIVPGPNQSMQRMQYLLTDYPAHAHKLIIRVVGYTLMGAFQASPEISLLLPDNERSSKKRDQAIVSGIVGGFLFFVAAIIVSLCAVKMCNKKKRRRTEKAYMTVTCAQGTEPGPISTGTLADVCSHTQTHSPLAIKK